jgi:hypothetical protein
VTVGEGQGFVGYAEKRGDYWRARYRVGPGLYATVSDENGRRIRFTTRRAAENAANDAEAKVRSGVWRDPAAGRVSFGEYASRWYAKQDLAASTMQNYRRHVEEHLLPKFERVAVRGHRGCRHRGLGASGAGGGLCSVEYQDVARHVASDPG